MLQTSNRWDYKDAVIASGASLSGVIDLEWGQMFAIEMPATWTAANLTLQAASDPAGTFKDVKDDSGTEVSITAAANIIIGVDTNALKIAALRYIKLRSGTSATPVAQAADRTIRLIRKV